MGRARNMIQRKFAIMRRWRGRWGMAVVRKLARTRDYEMASVGEDAPRGHFFDDLLGDHFLHQPFPSWIDSFFGLLLFGSGPYSESQEEVWTALNTAEI
jgi:hypothetical protein